MIITNIYLKSIFKTNKHKYNMYKELCSYINKIPTNNSLSLLYDYMTFVEAHNLL